MKEEKQKEHRYEMHKYWGKKPSRKLKTLIEKYSNAGDTVLDPFCGYGVFCCEAYILNRNVIANDLNPIANFINKQLFLQDVDFNKLIDNWLLIKSKFEPYTQQWYGMQLEGEYVELVNILRNKNNIPIKARYKDIKTNKMQEITLSENQIDIFLQFERNQNIEDWYPTETLIENSRISAKKNIKIFDLFTKRELACHSKLLNLIETNSSDNERELLKLAFTANLANCSKLVPPISSRGEMSQGAWMTGFYIGKTYIENNVLRYFENRLNKIIKGKKDYINCLKKNTSKKYQNTYKITQFDAKNLHINDNSIDYIFADPPYGDSVPYFEQSILWNSWLKFKPSYKDEIVISDSKQRKKTISSFEEDIYRSFSEIRRVLKQNGYFSLTYHSLSGLEWRAITNACIKNNFELVSYEWLVQKTFTPRQINRYKSIKGDVLVTLKKASSSNYTIMNNQEAQNFIKNAVKEWLYDKALDTNQILIKIMELIFYKKIIIGDIDIIDILNDNFILDNNTWSKK